jgi:hypothetical protein
LKIEELKNLEESQNDVNKYSKFFKNELQYDRTMTITDATKASSRDMRKKILEKIDQMLGAC